MLRYKIVHVSRRSVLPWQMSEQTAWNETQAFNVLKNDEYNYLLEMLPGGGGHTNQSDGIPAYWVSKDYCKRAYANKQRWLLNDFAIVEFDDNDLATVIQIIKPCEYYVGQTIKEYICNGKRTTWTYLSGQDAP